MDTGIMTRVLNQLLEIFSGGAEALGAEAFGLLSVLIAIEITWAALMWAFGGVDDLLRQYLKKVIHVGIFAFLTVNFASIANIIMDGFVWAGIEIGGGQLAISTMRDPSRIVDLGFVATASVWSEVASTSILDGQLVVNLMLAFVGMAIMLLYFLIALQVFITLVEFYLITSFGVIMIPWGVNKHTSFIAERYFGAILAQGVKLMVVVTLLGVVLPLVDGLMLEPDHTFTDAMSLLFGVATVGFLIWRAPNVASGLMSGAANLRAGDAVGMGMGAVLGAKGAAVAGAGAVATAATGGAAAPAAAGAALAGTKGAATAVKGASSSISNK